MKSRFLKHCLQSAIVAGMVAAGATSVRAQTFGVELHNTLMPASGAMAGTSIAQPQDFLSGINGNPATLTQFKGTQFTFSGAWADATVGAVIVPYLLVTFTSLSVSEILVIKTHDSETIRVWIFLLFHLRSQDITQREAKF